MNSNQNVETPIAFVKAIEEFFSIKFAYDLAATKENKKAPGYFCENDNSLEIPWPIYQWCFLNPPFRNVGAWVKKCKAEKQRGCKIISIWPLSGDLNQVDSWLHSTVYVIHGRVWPEVRGIMLCEWDRSRSRHHEKTVFNLRWNKKTLEYVN